MSLNPLTPVTDYQSMLNRIFWFTSAAALAAVWLLRSQLGEFDQWLKQIDFTLHLGDDNLLPIPGSYLLPAVAVGLGSRIFRIHAKLADWLGIRERFDIDVIVQELATRTGVDLAQVSDEKIVAQRSELMRRTFYAFVSGRQTSIDETLVHRALDLWSWFWIGLEATVVFVLAGFALVATGNHQTGLLTIVSALGFATIGLPAIRSECRRTAIAQVRAIVADPVRAAQVRAAFDDVRGGGQAPSLAA